jgi:ATP-dependent Lhr-like helicase
MAARRESDSPRWLEELRAARRAVEVSLGDEPRFIAVEDAARSRDVLGIALPPGLPPALLARVLDPRSDLVHRFARSHPPFTADDFAQRFTLSPTAARGLVESPVALGRLLERAPSGPAAQARAQRGNSAGPHCE